MTTIQLTDKAARVARINDIRGVVTVDLEWGGPDDRNVEDFDLAKLGKVFRAGTNGSAGRSGWVTLDGACLLAVGDTIHATEVDNG